MWATASNHQACARQPVTVSNVVQKPKGSFSTELTFELDGTTHTFRGHNSTAIAYPKPELIERIQALAFEVYDLRLETCEAFDGSDPAKLQELLTALAPVRDSAADVIGMTARYHGVDG